MHKLIQLYSAIFTSLFVTCAANAAAADSQHCLHLPDNEIYGVTYQSQRTLHGLTPSTPVDHHFWKMDNRVAHHYPERGFSEVWYRYSNHNLGFERWFHSQQRRISYDHSDLRSVGKTDEWKNVSQPLAFNRITKKITENAPTGDAIDYHCIKAQRFLFKEGRQSFEVLIDKSFEYPLAVTITDDSATTTVKLIDIENLERTKEYFDHGDQMESTDFADIGDNESDPFLRQIIKLGFVERQHRNDGMYPGHSH